MKMSLYEDDGKIIQDTLHACRGYMLPAAESPAQTETWVAMFDGADAALQRLTSAMGESAPKLPVISPEGMWGLYCRFESQFSESGKPQCDVTCKCGPHGEVLACFLEPGHDGDHSWDVLPSFVRTSR